jgi:hypothetical protein
MKKIKRSSSGIEKTSRNHATRYSFVFLSAFFVKASAEARLKAETRDNITQRYDIYE